MDFKDCFSQSNLNCELIKHTKTHSSHCYQCGKCSAGCPLAEDMDITPNMLVRMIQYEDDQIDKEILQSKTIWLCASCEMCVSRCPMEINIPGIMDYLRHQSVSKNLQNKSMNKNIISFHRSFLDMVRTTGRSYEIGLVVDYKLRSRKFLQDLTLAPKMFLKGKLPILPESVKDKGKIKTIFKTNQTNQ